jgi:serine/threonine protein kinase
MTTFQRAPSSFAPVSKENLNWGAAPNSAVLQDSPYIEHTRRDSRGNQVIFPYKFMQVHVLIMTCLILKVTKRYLKGALLGKGGFAKCYRITDMDTNQDWACKVVQKSSLVKQRHKAKVELCFIIITRNKRDLISFSHFQLQTEIKIHRGLGHKNVVKFEDVFEDHDNVYILMELCQNQTMLELVKRKKRLTEAETKRLMLQMVSALD